MIALHEPLGKSSEISRRMFVLFEYENVISLSDRTMLGSVACVGAGVASLTVCGVVMLMASSMMCHLVSV